MKTAFVIVLLLGLISPAHAASVSNGSLTGPSDEFSLLPDGWETLFPNPDIRWQPDTYGATTPTGNNALSPDGGTFVAAALALTQPPTGREGLQQTISNLVPGSSYRVSFFQSNLGVGETNITTFPDTTTYDWNAIAAWELFLDGTGTTLLSDPLAPEVGSLPNNSWFETSIVFTASSDIHALGFSPQIIQGDNAFLGIDGIQIAIVPLPPAILFFASGVATVFLSKRRGSSNNSRSSTSSDIAL